MRFNKIYIADLINRGGRVIKGNAILYQLKNMYVDLETNELYSKKFVSDEKIHLKTYLVIHMLKGQIHGWENNMDIDVKNHMSKTKGIEIARKFFYR